MHAMEKSPSPHLTRGEFLKLCLASAIGSGVFLIPWSRDNKTTEAQEELDPDYSNYLPIVLKQRPHIKGLCFSPYRNGQNPDTGPYPSKQQIKADISTINPIVEYIKTYGSDHGFDNIPGYILELGFDIKVNAGCWLGPDSDAVNSSLIDNLVSEVNRYPNVISATVGNETQEFNSVHEDDLINYITDVKQRVRSDVLVTTGDTWSAWYQHPNVVNATDYILAHFHPYWEGIDITNAVSFIEEKYDLLQSQYPDKLITIGETGWPSAGEAYGAAIPSPENQKNFIDQFIAWATQKRIDFYLFESFDENWKKKYEGEVGGHWGIYNTNRTPKYPGLTIK